VASSSVWNGPQWNLTQTRTSLHTRPVCLSACLSVCLDLCVCVRVVYEPLAPSEVCIFLRVCIVSIHFITHSLIHSIITTVSVYIANCLPACLSTIRLSALPHAYHGYTTLSLVASCHVIPCHTCLPICSSVWLFVGCCVSPVGLTVVCACFSRDGKCISSLPRVCLSCWIVPVIPPTSDRYVHISMPRWLSHLNAP